MATRAEQLHMSTVAGLGCVVCRNLGYGATPANIHHLRDGQGASQRASHFEVLPLCKNHHQDGGYGVAFHAGEKEWESRYGTERKLLAQVMEEVELAKEDLIGGGCAC